MEELSTGIGFTPISSFRGIFDGQNKKISNLYINSNELYVGFFAEVGSATIKNFILNGEINYIGDRNFSIGGVVGLIHGKCFLDSLEYSGAIGINGQSNSYAVGGIVGNINESSNTEVNKCVNKSNIISNIYTGGIVGKNYGKLKIVNCYNLGDLTLKRANFLQSYYSVGGIFGCCTRGDVIIENSYNTGIIINELSNVYSGAGGILGTSGDLNANITNCYNIGKTSSKYLYITPFSGGIQGGFWYNQYKSNISNCYYDGAKSDRSVGGATKEYATKLTTNQMQGKEKIENKDGTSSTLVELLNKEIDNNSTGADTSSWLRWKQGENGYPTFVEM